MKNSNKIRYVGASRVIRHYLPLIMYVVATLPLLKVLLMTVMSSPTYITMHPLEVGNAILFLLACVIIGVICDYFKSSCEFKELMREEERRTIEMLRRVEEIQKHNAEQDAAYSFTGIPTTPAPTEVEETEKEEVPAPKKRYKKRRGGKKHY